MNEIFYEELEKIAKKKKIKKGKKWIERHPTLATAGIGTGIIFSALGLRKGQKFVRKMLEKGPTIGSMSPAKFKRLLKSYWKKKGVKHGPIMVD